MLTVLVGQNTSARASRLKALLAPFEKKRSEILVYTDATVDSQSLRALAESTSLFGGETIAVISGVGDVSAIRDELKAILPELAQSSQHFFISESVLPIDFKKSAEKARAIIEEFVEKNKGKKEEIFNIFLLTDAFSARKRSLTWALYRKALSLGLEPREIHSKIFWAVKTMIIVQTASSAKEAGIHPFVYEKARNSSQNFIPRELEKIAVDLTTLFHDTLANGTNFEIEMEAFILRTLAKPAQVKGV